MSKVKVQHFFDQDTNTLTYVVYDSVSLDAAIIDPVLDYQPAGAEISFGSFANLCTWIDQQSLKPQMVIETHAHADHLSSSQYLKTRYPGLKVGISERITRVQQRFKEIFNLENLATDGSQFEVLFKDNETHQVGSLSFEIIPVPGHTPACTAFKFAEHVFVGDLIFTPDFGTGRCDFPDGDAAASYNSIKCLYDLPDETKLYVGHDYMPGGRPLEFTSTVGEQKVDNIHLKESTSLEEFVGFRTKRDAQLTAPRLLFESVQFNIDGGHMPPQAGNGRRYLRIPLTVHEPSI